MMIVADNLHVVNPVVADAILRMDSGPIGDLVLRCQTAGAQAIDVNSGPLPKNAAGHFSFLIETVQEYTSLPLVLDTTNPVALEAGLRVCRRPPVINGFSLEPRKLEHILPLAISNNVDVIGYLLGPNSQVPVDQEEIMALAVEVFDVYTRAGGDPQRLIVDPVITPLSWDNGIRHNRAVLKVIPALSDLLGVPLRTIAGVSNLASGPYPQARKIELERTFLAMLAAAGLDMALLNVFHGPTVRTAGLCNALLGDSIFAWEPEQGADG